MSLIGDLRRDDAPRVASLGQPSRATTERRDALAQAEAQLIGERQRLGREIHDVVAHTLGVVSVQLTALDSRVVAGDARADVRARIAAIHRLVGDGLGEARDTVRALREPGPPLVTRLERLCDLHGARFEVQGESRDVGPDAVLTLHRVAQEALTNAAKHAPGSPVCVGLGFDADGVELRIDSRRAHTAAASPLSCAGGGYGLVSMRERVQLIGGSLTAGPTEDGWCVTAEIPALPAERGCPHGPG